MMLAGVMKSGSPTPKLITFSPAAFISADFADIASVIEGAMPLTLFVSLIMLISVKRPDGRPKKFILLTLYNAAADFANV